LRCTLDTEPGTLQLFKDFDLVSGDFPPIELVRTGTEIGQLLPDGKVAIGTRLGASKFPTSALISFIIRDTTDGSLKVRQAYTMSCAANPCAYSGFQLERGRKYDILVWVEATSGGKKYTDFANGVLVMPSLVSIGGVPATGLDPRQGEFKLEATVLVPGGMTNLKLSEDRVELSTTGSNPQHFDVPVRLVGGNNLVPGQHEITLEFLGTMDQEFPRETFSGKVSFTATRDGEGKIEVNPADIPINFTERGTKVTILKQDLLDFGDVDGTGAQNQKIVVIPLEIPRQIGIRSVIATLEPSRDGITITAGTLARKDDRYELPLVLAVNQSITETNYRGTVRLLGSTRYVSFSPFDEVPFQFRYTSLWDRITRFVLPHWNTFVQDWVPPPISFDKVIRYIVVLILLLLLIAIRNRRQYEPVNWDSPDPPSEDV
jgi:hypothetical protein